MGCDKNFHAFGILRVMPYDYSATSEKMDWFDQKIEGVFFEENQIFDHFFKTHSSICEVEFGVGDCTWETSHQDM